MKFNNDLAPYLFHQGTNYCAYDYLGCNLNIINGRYHYSFRTWAPNAIKVELVSDFTGWDTPVSLNKISEKGIWEYIYITDISIEKCAYKFRITSHSGVKHKADPYARFSRGLADGASLVFTSDKFHWCDDEWLSYRKKTVLTNKDVFLPTPINIYEVHLGSFMRHEDNTVLSYRELADVLAPYVKSLGFTHVELLPVMEHPFDGSWGYQVCGFYAPTSRFGDPDDFRYFINKMHTLGIGVILDWVPAHFPKDEWGLYEFDGMPLYEYQGNDRKESRSWGTRFFDVAREEVQSFLISNALYYLREFHVDGLRVDAVASMLYLDYDRDAGEWIPNQFGTNLNLESLAFFKKLNSAVHGEFSDVLMIAEESTSFGILTKNITDGGLGFDMKWNMGWANDFYDYVSTDPYFRKYKHKALNFPIMYAFTENYCLPISHDEVVHGKKSFLDKMYGSQEDKFSQMRASLLLMMTYPGKKMMFMGTEYAPFREWDYENSLEWFMLDYDNHRAMRDYVRELNSFYLDNSELWEIDFDSRGFTWLLADENEKNVVAYRRNNIAGDSLIAVINFSGSNQTVRFEIKDNCSLSSVFASSYGDFEKDISVFKAEDKCYAEIRLGSFSGIILKEISKLKNIKL